MTADEVAQGCAAPGLPSWNDGAAEKSIVEFVGRVTDEGGPDHVAPAERIATFDNDRESSILSGGTPVDYDGLRDLGRQPGGAGANVPGLRGADAQDRAVHPQGNLVPAPEILCLRTSMPPGTTDVPGQAHWRQTLSCNELDGRFWRSC